MHNIHPLWSGSGNIYCINMQKSDEYTQNMHYLARKSEYLTAYLPNYSEKSRFPHSYIMMQQQKDGRNLIIS